MLNKLINIEEVERKPFKRHFIRNVVLELSFNDLNKETLINNKEKLQSAFKQLGFVKFGEMKQIEFKMTVDKDTPEQIKNEDETKVNKKQIENLAHDKFGNLAGIAQQYLFYWKREA